VILVTGVNDDDFSFLLTDSRV